MESRKRKCENNLDENQVPKSRRFSTSNEETDTDSERSSTPLVPLRSQSRNSSVANSPGGDTASEASKETNKASPPNKDPDQILNDILDYIKKIEKGEVKEIICTPQDYICVCLRTAIKRDMHELVVKLLNNERCKSYGLNPNYVDKKHNCKSIFIHVCIVGNKNVVRVFLDHDQVDVGMADLLGNGALHHAAMLNNAETVEMLVKDERININATNKSGNSALMLASTEGATGSVEKILGVEGVEINCADENGDTAMLHSAVGGYVDIVQMLLRYKGIKIDKSNHNGDTALMCAANEMKTDIVKLLVDNNCDVNIKNSDGYTALMCGADKGDVQIVQTLLSSPTIDINLEDSKGNNALSWAVDKNQYEIVKMFVSRDDLSSSTKNVEEVTYLVLNRRGSDTNSFLDAAIKAVKSHQVEIALFILRSVQFVACAYLDSIFLYSAQEGFVEIVKQLLKSNVVDVNVVDEKYKNTAMIIAIGNENETESRQIVQLLLKHGANADIKGYEDNTALTLACSKKRSDLVKILVEHNADVNMPGEDDYTPLMLAGGHDDIETVKSLLKAPGIDVNLRSGRDEKSALLWAAENGHKKTVQLLVKQEKERINMNVQDSNGYTALMWGADNGHVGCVSALLQHPGVDVNVLDSDGHSALTWACDKGHTEIVKLLLRNQALKIDIVDNEGYSPFICAASSGRSKVFSLLLNDERTNVNIKVGRED